MWSLYLSIGGVVVLLGITLPLAFHARSTSRKLGEAKGKINEQEHEIRRLRGALLVQGDLVRELGKPDPTPGILVDALRRQVGAETGDQ